MFRSEYSIGRQSFSVMSGWISSGLKTVTETAKSVFTKGGVYVVPMLPYTKTRILSTVQTVIHQTLIKTFSTNEKQTNAIDQSLTRFFENPLFQSRMYAFIYEHRMRLYQQVNQVDLPTLFAIMQTNEGQLLLRDVILSEQGINLIATIMSVVYPKHAPNISSAEPFLKSILGHPAIQSIIINLVDSELVRSQMTALILEPGYDKALLTQLLINHPPFQNILANAMLDDGQFSKNGSELMQHILSKNGISFIGNSISIVYPQHAPNINRLLPFISSILKQPEVQEIIIRLLSSPFVRGKILECVSHPDRIQDLLLHTECQDIFRDAMLDDGKLNGFGRKLMRRLLSEEPMAFIDENKATLNLGPDSIIARALPVFIPLLQHPAMKRIIVDLTDSAFVRERMYALIDKQKVDTATLALVLLQDPDCQAIVGKVMLDPKKGNLNDTGRALMDDILSQEVIAFIASYLQTIPNINDIRQFLDQPTIKSIIIGLLDSAYVRGEILKCVEDRAHIQASLALDLLRQPDCQAIIGRVMLESKKGKLNAEGHKLIDYVLSEQSIALMSNIIKETKMRSALSFLISVLGQPAVKSIIPGLANSAFVRGKMYALIDNPEVDKASLVQDLLLHRECQDIVRDVMLDGGKLNGIARALMYDILSQDMIAFMASYLQTIPNIEGIRQFLDQHTIKSIIIGLLDSAYVRGKILECVRNPDRIQASLALDLLRQPDCKAIIGRVMLESKKGKLNAEARELIDYVLSEQSIALMSNSIKETEMSRALPFLISVLGQPAVKSIIPGLANSAFVRGKMYALIHNTEVDKASLVQDLLRHTRCQAIVGRFMLEGGKLNGIGRQLMCHLLSEEAIVFINENKATLNLDPESIIARALPVFIPLLQHSAMKRIIVDLLDSAFVRGRMYELIDNPEVDKASLVQDLLLHRECQDIVRDVMLEGGKLNGFGRQLMCHLLSEEAIVFINENKETLKLEPDSIIARALPVFIPLLQHPAMKRIIVDLLDSAFVRGSMYELIDNPEVDKAALVQDLLLHRECQDIVRDVMLDGGKLNCISRALVDDILSQEVIAFIASYLQTIPNIDDIRQFLDQPTIKSIIKGLLDSTYVRGEILECVRNRARIQASLALDLLRQPDCQAIVDAIMFKEGQFSDNGRALMKHILSAGGIALIGNSMSTFYPGQEHTLEMIQFLTSVVQHPAMTQIILDLGNYSKFREIIFEHVINPVGVFEKYKFAIAIIYDPTCQEIVRRVMADRSGQELVSERILSVTGKRHIANFITNVLSTEYTVEELDEKIGKIGYIIQVADDLASQTEKTSEHLSTFHNYIRSVLQSVLSANVQAYFIDPADPLGKIKRYEKTPDSPREVVFVHKLMNLLFDLSNIFKAIEELPLQKGAGFTNLAIETFFTKVLKIWDDANVLIKDVLEFSADLEDIMESQFFSDENLLEKIEHLIKQDDVLGNLYQELADRTVVFPEINLGKWLGIFIQSFRQENKDNKLMLFISKLPQYLEGIATEFELKLRTLKEDGTLPAQLEKLNNAQEKLKRMAIDLKRISQKDVVFELNIMSLIYHGPQIWSLGKEILESGQHVLLYSKAYTKMMLTKLKYNWFLEAMHFLGRCENNFFIARGTLSTPVLAFVGEYYQKAIADIAPYIDLEADLKLSDFNDLSELRFERSVSEYAINERWLLRYMSHLQILQRLIQTSQSNLESTDVDQLRADLEELSPYMRRVDDLWYRNLYLELSKDKPNFENILVTTKLEHALIHLHQELNSSLEKKERFISEFEDQSIIPKSQEEEVKALAETDFQAQVNQAKKVACLAPALELAIHAHWLERYKNHLQLIDRVRSQLNRGVLDRLDSELLPYISDDDASQFNLELSEPSPNLAVFSKILDTATEKLAEETEITLRKITQLKRASFIDEVSIKSKVQLKAKQIYDAQVLANPAGCSKREDSEQRGYFNNSTLFFDWLNAIASGAKEVVNESYSTEVSGHIKSLEEDSPLSKVHKETKVVVNGLEYLRTVWNILQAYEPTHFQDSQHIIGFEQIARNAELIWNGHQLFLSYRALSIHEHQLMLYRLSNSFQDLLPEQVVLNYLTEQRDHVGVFGFLMAPQLVAYLAEPANNQLTIANTRKIADLSRIHGEKLDAILEHSGSYSLLWYFFDIKELVLQSQSNMSMLAKQLHALMVSSTFKMNILEKFDQIVCTLGINPKLAQDLVQSMRGFFLEVLTYSMSSPQNLRKLYQDMSAFDVRVDKMRTRHEAILENIRQCQPLIDFLRVNESLQYSHTEVLTALFGDGFTKSKKGSDQLKQLEHHKSRLELEASLIVQHIEHLEQQPQELSRHEQHLNVFDDLCKQFMIDRQSRFIDYQRQYQTAIDQFFVTERQTFSQKCDELTEEQFEPEVNKIFKKFDTQHKGFHQKYKYLQTLLDIVKQIEGKLQDVNPEQDWFDDKDTLERKQKGIRELKELFNVDDTEPVPDESLRMIHTHIMAFADFNEAMSEWCPVTFNAPHLGLIGDLLGWLWGCIYELARWFVSLCYEPAGQKGLAKLQNVSMRFFPPANEQILSPPIGLPAPCAL